MNHKTEIVKQKQVSDTSIAITIQCCGDPKTASTITIANAHQLTTTQASVQIDSHHDAVKAKHEGILRGQDILNGLTNRTKEYPA
jgi:hypothetical protein